LAQLGFAEINTTNPDANRFDPQVEIAAQAEIEERKRTIFRQFDSGEINDEGFASAITALNAQIPSVYERISQNTNG
jgi:hypothetical protein